MSTNDPNCIENIKEIVDYIQKITQLYYDRELLSDIDADHYKRGLDDIDNLMQSINSKCDVDTFKVIIDILQDAYSVIAKDYTNKKNGTTKIDKIYFVNDDLASNNWRTVNFNVISKLLSYIFYLYSFVVYCKEVLKEKTPNSPTKEIYLKIFNQAEQRYFYDIKLYNGTNCDLSCFSKDMLNRYTEDTNNEFLQRIYNLTYMMGYILVMTISFITDTFSDNPEIINHIEGLFTEQTNKIMGGFSSEEEEMQRAKEIVQMHINGGFVNSNILTNYALSIIKYVKAIQDGFSQMYKLVKGVIGITNDVDNSKSAILLEDAFNIDLMKIISEVIKISDILNKDKTYLYNVFGENYGIKVNEITKILDNIAFFCDQKISNNKYKEPEIESLLSKLKDLKECSKQLSTKILEFSKIEKPHSDNPTILTTILSTTYEKFGDFPSIYEKITKLRNIISKIRRRLISFIIYGFTAEANKMIHDHTLKKETENKYVNPLFEDMKDQIEFVKKKELTKYSEHLIATTLQILNMKIISINALANILKFMVRSINLANTFIYNKVMSTYNFAFDVSMAVYEISSLIKNFENIIREDNNNIVINEHDIKNGLDSLFFGTKNSHVIKILVNLFYQCLHFGNKNIKEKLKSEFYIKKRDFNSMLITLLNSFSIFIHKLKQEDVNLGMLFFYSRIIGTSKVESTGPSLNIGYRFDASALFYILLILTSMMGRILWAFGFRKEVHDTQINFLDNSLPSKAFYGGAAIEKRKNQVIIHTDRISLYYQIFYTIEIFKIYVNEVNKNEIFKLHIKPSIETSLFRFLINKFLIENTNPHQSDTLEKTKEFIQIINEVYDFYTSNPKDKIPITYYTLLLTLVEEVNACFYITFNSEKLDQNKFEEKRLGLNFIPSIAGFYEILDPEKKTKKSTTEDVFIDPSPLPQKLNPVYDQKVIHTLIQSIDNIVKKLDTRFDNLADKNISTMTHLCMSVDDDQSLENKEENKLEIFNYYLNTDRKINILNLKTFIMLYEYAVSQLDFMFSILNVLFLGTSSDLVYNKHNFLSVLETKGNEGKYTIKKILEMKDEDLKTIINEVVDDILTQKRNENSLTRYSSDIVSRKINVSNFGHYINDMIYNYINNKTMFYYWLSDLSGLVENHRHFNYFDALHDLNYGCHPLVLRGKIDYYTATKPINFVHKDKLITFENTNGNQYDEVTVVHLNGKSVHNINSENKIEKINIKGAQITYFFDKRILIEIKDVKSKDSEVEGEFQGTLFSFEFYLSGLRNRMTFDKTLWIEMFLGIRCESAMIEDYNYITLRDTYQNVNSDRGTSDKLDPVADFVPAVFRNTATFSYYFPEANLSWRTITEKILLRKSTTGNNLDEVKMTGNHSNLISPNFPKIFNNTPSTYLSKTKEVIEFFENYLMLLISLEEHNFIFIETENINGEKSLRIDMDDLFAALKNYSIGLIDIVSGRQDPPTVKLDFSYSRTGEKIKNFLGLLNVFSPKTTGIKKNLTNIKKPPINMDDPDYTHILQNYYKYLRAEKRILIWALLHMCFNSADKSLFDVCTVLFHTDDGKLFYEFHHPYIDDPTNVRKAPRTFNDLGQEVQEKILSLLPFLLTRIKHNAIKLRMISDFYPDIAFHPDFKNIVDSYEFLLNNLSPFESLIIKLSPEYSSLLFSNTREYGRNKSNLNLNKKNNPPLALPSFMSKLPESEWDQFAVLWASTLIVYPNNIKEIFSNFLKILKGSSYIDSVKAEEYLESYLKLCRPFVLNHFYCSIGNRVTIKSISEETAYINEISSSIGDLYKTNIQHEQIAISNFVNLQIPLLNFGKLYLGTYFLQLYLLDKIFWEALSSSTHKLNFDDQYIDLSLAELNDIGEKNIYNIYVSLLYVGLQIIKSKIEDDIKNMALPSIQKI